MKWILIIWVSGHQLPVYGYSREDCIDAAQVARQEMAKFNRRADIYCIPGPKE